jgi:4-coumarate--CoA ligase
MMRIYRSTLPTIPVLNESIFTNIFVTNFNKHSPDSPAYIDAATGFTLSRSQTRDLSLSFAYGLQSGFVEMGGVELSRGDVVLILSPNSVAWPVVVFGAWAAGLRTTLANSSYTPREIAYQWQDSRAKAVIVHPALLPVTLNTFRMLDMDLTDARRRIIVADWAISPPPIGVEGFICMKDLLIKGSLAEEEKFSGAQAHETVLLCYSSGTTGQPKGVEVCRPCLTQNLSKLTSFRLRTRISPLRLL